MIIAILSTWYDGMKFGYLHWYYIRGSRMYITHMKRNSSTPYVVSNQQEGGGGPVCSFKLTRGGGVKYHFLFNCILMLLIV